MVYVIGIDGKPLMPTNNAKARILLKEKKATVRTIKPFTIKLTYQTDTEYVQPITLGIDSGYLNIGFSAVTDKKELISGEVKLLDKMKERIYEKSMYRTIRRNKLRYRKPRWNNRIKSKKKGWLAPSITHKLDSHLVFVDKITKILPIQKIIVEVANFDIQKIKNPDIQGVEYQQGEQMGFWNLREYILHRDGHKCQNPNCKNKDASPILEVHHIDNRINGGADTPTNLITLCNKCHTPANHKGFLKNWKPKIKGFKDSTFMSIVRWRMIDELKNRYDNVEYTYGYITKNSRIRNSIEKSHSNDAFCIAKGTNQQRCKESFDVEQVRRNNRSLEKFFDAKVIDRRTGKPARGGELSCGRTTRNKNKNSENLRKYRGKTLKKGRRQIRRQKYFYQNNDLIKLENKIYTCGGMAGYGKYVYIKEMENKKVRVDAVKPYKFCKGFVFK